MIATLLDAMLCDVVGFLEIVVIVLDSFSVEPLMLEAEAGSSSGAVEVLGAFGVFGVVCCSWVLGPLLGVSGASAVCFCIYQHDDIQGMMAKRRANSSCGWCSPNLQTLVLLDSTRCPGVLLHRGHDGICARGGLCMACRLRVLLVRK